MLAKELSEYLINNPDEIEKILEELGFGKILNRGRYISACVPNFNNASGFSILIENLYCKSFTTNFSFNGHLFDLVAHMKGYTNFGDTMRFIHKILNIPYSYSKKEDNTPKDSILDFFKKYKTKPNKRNTKEVELKFYTDEEIFGMYPQCPYSGWIREGITAKTQKEFAIGYHFDSDRIVIPHRHWKTGEIIGLIGRTLKSAEICEYFDIPKYFPIIPYKKGCNLYGLWENRQYIEEAKGVIVFESEKSVMKMRSRGINNCVCVCCHDLSEEQVKILLSLNVNEIIIAYDSDVDKEFIAMECKKFKGLRNVSAILNKDNILGEKESPADVCLKDYKFLYDNRVKYKPKKVK